MEKLTKYTQSSHENYLLRMFEGMANATKNKIIKARKFPKNVADSFDLFKAYFFSDEGLADVIAELSPDEIVLLHIMHFNQWSANVVFFQSIYTPLPKVERSYYGETFSQKYGSLMKQVQTRLVQKGVLMQYETTDYTKAERQRFIFPPTFAAHLPSPFANLQSVEAENTSGKDNLGGGLLKAMRDSMGGKDDVISLKWKKFHIGKELFDVEELDKLRLKTWRAEKGSTVLATKFLEKGGYLSDFILHHLSQLSDNQWLTKASFLPIASIWENPRKRKRHLGGDEFQSKYDWKECYESGWKCDFLKKRHAKNGTLYGLAQPDAKQLGFGDYLEPNEEGALMVDLRKIPFPILEILNRLSFFTHNTEAFAFSDLNKKHFVQAEPDLIHLADIKPQDWQHPLFAWLEQNASAYKATFDYYRANYGKQIVHSNLLVAQIKDLSLRVLVEKEVNKKYKTVVLSEEFIAFPQDALAVVERVVSKSKNVINWKAASQTT